MGMYNVWIHSNKSAPIYIFLHVIGVKRRSQKYFTFKTVASIMVEGNWVEKGESHVYMQAAQDFLHAGPESEPAWTALRNAR